MLRSLGDMNRLVDIRVSRGQFLGFKQFYEPVLHVTGMAVNETEVFMQLRTSAAVAAKLQRLFKLGDRLGPVMRGGGRQGEVA